MAIITPNYVHELLGKYMQVSGLDIVMDLEKSHGSYCYDSRENKEYLDLFSMFASAPVGHNHPRLYEDPFLKKLIRCAVNNVTNSDLYTIEMAEFVRDFFIKVVVEKHFKYTFFVAGGALGVENAIKTAFDWKVRKNFEKGYKEERGHQIMHFKEAFHGRSGYTLSLTNTADPRKYKYFTKFNWPRIENPKITFPLEGENLRKVIELEEIAIKQIYKAFDENQDDIAAIIIEPIQGEGGDNHFRREFLKKLQDICHEKEALFILDEVQTGVGMTGLWWAYEHFDLEPDCISFGKKAQVCGFLASSRIDEVKDNVFQEDSRINSTWGGNLIDMVRFRRYIEIIEEENLIENSAKQGAYLLDGLYNLQKEYPDTISNVRGRGLMCAFDLRTTQERDKFVELLFKNGALILGCGTKSIRFRPALNIQREELSQALNIIEKSINQMK